MDKQLENIGYSKDDPLRNSRIKAWVSGEEGENGQRRTKTGTRDKETSGKETSKRKR